VVLALVESLQSVDKILLQLRFLTTLLYSKWVYAVIKPQLGRGVGLEAHPEGHWTFSHPLVWAMLAPPQTFKSRFAVDH
jgi:hypothetical protein